MTSTASSYRLGPLEQIPPGEGHAFDLGGEQVAVFRLRSGALRAISAICPHAGGPLADGQIDEEVVICPLHQNVFELASGCSRSGQPAVNSYSVRVEDGDLVVDLTP